MQTFGAAFYRSKAKVRGDDGNTLFAENPQEKDIGFKIILKIVRIRGDSTAVDLDGRQEKRVW